MRKKERMHKIYVVTMVILITVTILQNLLAWLSTDYADWHRVHIFPFFQNIMTSFSNVFPFSLGELLLCMAAVFAMAMMIAGIAYFISRLNGISVKGYERFFKTAGFIIAGTAFVMTNNCFILYHSTGLEGSYLNGASESEYDFETLAESREFIVERVNALAKEIERDEDGNPKFTGNMADEAVKAMQNLGLQWNELLGQYSVPKPLLASEFMCQQSMRGYYFPFTMEANYNAEMTEINMPSTMCHELAHTKGFIKEDEANFIAYVACINSDNKFFQYSGYLSVLNYINNDFKEACSECTGLYSSYTKISKQVKQDNVFMLAKVEEKVEKNAIIPTKTVRAAAKSYVDITLAANGIPEGSVTYSKVVGLLIYSREAENVEMLAQAG